jgi:hypothetical protein
MGRPLHGGFVADVDPYAGGELRVERPDRRAQLYIVEVEIFGAVLRILNGLRSR